MKRISKSIVMVIAAGFFASVNACGGASDVERETDVDELDQTLRADRVACTSSADCREGQFCTTERGDCRPPPGCRRGEVCPAVCYGVCRQQKEPVACGNVTCGRGQVCCNESCGICTRPGGVCTQQICDPAVECRRDADCRTFSDLCTGCDCRALANSEPDPVCPGPGVQCLIDPCFNQAAVCARGQCVLVTTR